MRLYELQGKYLELMEMADDPDVDFEMLMDTLEGVDGSIEDKADNYAKLIRNMESDVKQIDEEMKRLQNRKNALANRAKDLKENLQNAMTTTGKTKFKTTLFSFGIQKNPPSVKLRSDDWHDVPREFLIDREPVIDKKGIMDALKGGEELGFAWLEQGESLRIR